MSIIEINAGTIHYEEFGPIDGRPVVFVHGYMTGGQLAGGRSAPDRPRRACGASPSTRPLGAHPRTAARPRRRPEHPVDRRQRRRHPGRAGPAGRRPGRQRHRRRGHPAGGGAPSERIGALVLDEPDDVFEHFPAAHPEATDRGRPGPGPFLDCRPVGPDPGRRKRAYAASPSLGHRRASPASGSAPALSNPAIAEDLLRQFTALSLRTEVTTVAARHARIRQSRRSSRGRPMTCSSRSATANDWRSSSPWPASRSSTAPCTFSMVRSPGPAGRPAADDRRPCLILPRADA